MAHPRPAAAPLAPLPQTGGAGRVPATGGVPPSTEVILVRRLLQLPPPPLLLLLLLLPAATACTCSQLAGAILALAFWMPGVCWLARLPGAADVPPLVLLPTITG